MTIQYDRNACEQCEGDIRIRSSFGHRTAAGFRWYAKEGDEAECVACGEPYIVVVEENEGHAWLKSTAREEV